MKKGIVGSNTFCQAPFSEEYGHPPAPKGAMLRVNDRDTLVPERPWKQIKRIKPRNRRWFWYSVVYRWEETLHEETGAVVHRKLVVDHVRSQGTYDPNRAQRMEALKMQRLAHHAAI